MAECVRCGAYTKFEKDLFLDCHNKKSTTIIKYVDLLLQLNQDQKENTLQTKVDQLKQRIEHTEEKINQIIYELYELTPEEIKIVEESVNQ